jgi:D-alanyl-D-alanine dipeptidase
MEGKFRESGLKVMAAIIIVAVTSFLLGGYYEGRRYGVDVGTVLVERDVLQSSLMQRTEERDALEKSLEALKEQMDAVQTELTSVSSERDTLLAENEKLGKDHAIVIRSNLVEVTALDPRIEVQLRYATTDNFMNRKVYPDNSKALLRTETAIKLVKANAIFEADGYSIKIWDGYRPPEIQEILWEIMPDPKFVADPKKGSNHSRGTAVDLTLVDRNGKEVAMPTDHDDFSAEAGRSYTGHLEEVKKNLAYLTDVMKRAGFTTINSEWWHYDDSNASGYGIIDASFDDFD